jgi:hypothetical protein
VTLVANSSEPPETQDFTFLAAPFGWVRDHGDLGLVQYVMALAELDRLDRGATTGPASPR